MIRRKAPFIRKQSQDRRPRRRGGELPKRFSDDDTVQEKVQELLNKLDPFDPISLNDDVMSQRIRELVERTAALSRSKVETKKRLPPMKIQKIATSECRQPRVSQ